MGIEVCLLKFTESEILGDYEEMRSLKEDGLKAIESQLGEMPDWNEGTTGDEESLPLPGIESLLQLQRYAAHVDLNGYPAKAPAEIESLFEDDCLNTYWEVANEEMANTNTYRFLHLIWTGSVGIFYIPVDFPEPILIENVGSDGDEDDEQENEYISVGSAERLLTELDELKERLQLQGDYEELGESVAIEIYENDLDPWNEVKWAWMVLHWMARQAIGKKLTLCFE